MIPKTTKENIEKFNNSDIGRIKNKYIKRAMIVGIVSVMSGIVWLILNIFYNLIWYEYITPSILILFGIYFIINTKFIKIKEVNKFINEKKK